MNQNTYPVQEVNFWLRPKLESNFYVNKARVKNLGYKK